MQRKKKELHVMTKDYVRERRVMNKQKVKQNNLSEKNNNQLSKILNVINHLILVEIRTTQEREERV